jgi:hypothetical protein
MKKYSWWISLFLFLQPLVITGQTLVPYNFLRAVANGTRTLDGIPGPYYYQNSADYHIDVNFNPRDGKLLGSADIRYYNNSTDTLRMIVMKLYQNLLKPGTPTDFVIDASILTHGVAITSLVVDDFNLSENMAKRTRTEGTLFTIYLPKALTPLNFSKIHIEWNFIMPQVEVHRYGKYNEGSYFIGYWYPQISVHDDMDGWDQIHPMGTQEFYNDFNNYYVNITVPSGFMVWATGTWENPQQILSSNILSLFQKAKTSDDVVRIITKDDLKNNNIYLRKGQKTFRYSAEQVPDFAFGVSDRYLWDATSVINDSIDKRRVTVTAAYLPGAENFDLVAGMGAEVIGRFVKNGYGIPYPYPSVTVFNGDGGMEYPMIVNNGNSFSKKGTLYVTMHEIAHAYFPFLTGINETKYGWMDEGLTSFLPMEIDKSMGSDYHTLEEVTHQYETLAGTETDIPLLVPSWQTREQAYFYLSYAKSVVAFSMLESLMGKQSFRKGIQNFIGTWEYKHPTPYDFFNVLKNSTNCELDWFIDAWFFQMGWPDLAIGDVNLTGNNLKVEVKKLGLLPVPVVLQIKYKSLETDTLKYNAGVWKDKNLLTFTLAIYDEVESIRLGTSTIPDKNSKNNYIDYSEGEVTDANNSR